MGSPIITDEQMTRKRAKTLIGLALASSLRRLRALTAPLQGCIAVCTITIVAGLGGCAYRDFGRYGGKKGITFCRVCRLQTKEEGSGRKIKQRDQAVRSSLEVCPTRVIEVIDRTVAVGIADNRGIVP
jgi:hypothetical protein